MIAQIMSDQWQKRFQRRQQAGQHKRIRSGIKNFEGRIHNKTFKIKQLIAVPQNVQAKSPDEAESTDVEDGVQDLILMVGVGLLKLLRANIKSLKLPLILKTTLKRLNSFLFLINTKIDGADKNDSTNNVRSVTKKIPKKTTSRSTQKN